MDLDDEKHAYLVVGGELEYMHQQHFRDLSKVVIYGPFDSRENAYVSWREHSLKNVDNALMRFRIVKVY